MKRSNSMALDDIKSIKLDIGKENKETQNSLLKAKPETKGTPTKLQVERRVGASRVLCNLPTIEEDQVDDETIDVLSSLEKQVSKVNNIVGKPKRPKKELSSRRLEYNSDNQKIEK